MRSRIVDFLRKRKREVNAGMGESALVRAFRTPLGQVWLSAEQARINDLLKEYRGAKILYLSVTPDLRPENPSQFRTVTHVFSAQQSAYSDIGKQTVLEADFEALPFESESFDIVIVQHVLEFDSNPQGAMKEAARVTKPLGHMVVLAFNPLSVSGFISMLTRRFLVESIWCHRPLLVYRLRDWLQFVDFKCLSVENLGHCMPINSARLRGLNEKIGSILGRVNAPFAAVVCIVARKDQFDMLLSKRRWQKMRAAHTLFAPSPTATTFVVNEKSLDEQ